MPERRFLEEGLGAAAAALPLALVRPDSVSRLLSIARRAPLPAPYFGFDCSLARGEAGVDFGFPLERAALEQELSSGRARDGAVWSALAPFLDVWLDAKAGLSPWVPFVFLEFDEEQHADPALRPSVFVALDWPIGAEDGDPALAEVAARALAALQGDRLSSEIERRLKRCFELAPSAGGGILHVGAMQGRPGTPVRVSALLSPALLWDFLLEVGWKGSARDGQRELSGWLDTERPMQVDFDLSGEVGEKLGFTLQREDEAGWRALLDTLVARGLCDPAKAGALIQWPGASSAVLASRPGRTLLRREITYLKWSYQRDRAAAKAYFSVIPVRSLFG